MGGLFGGGAKSSGGGAPQVVYMPSVPQYIPAPSDNSAEVKASAEQQRKAAALAKGRQSTLLTGGTGLEDTATVNRRSLLGE